MFWINGKCNSMYYNGECDGKNPPTDCPYKGEKNVWTKFKKNIKRFK